MEDQRARAAGGRSGNRSPLRPHDLPAQDETLLHLFEATSPDALRQAARDAALAYERIVEAVEGSAEPQERNEENGERGGKWPGTGRSRWGSR